MQKRDYYEILEITREASSSEIKKAYRRLAHKYHPDRNQEDGAEAKFKEAAEAYEILSDPEKKNNYDTFGHNSPRTVGSGNFDPFDIFSSVFGGGFSHGRRRRGRDIHTEIQINLKDVLKGTKKDFEFTRQRQCETCKGIGGKGSTCSACGGYGQVKQQNGFIQVVTTCPQCKGSRIKITSRCKDCNGNGSIGERRKVTIKIPPGVQTGTQIRVTGEGDLDSSSLPGDLLCGIRVRPHSKFERSRQDLQCVSLLAFTEACLGVTIKVPTLDGKDKDLVIPPGTQFGQVFRIEKQGLPALKGKKNRGHLYVKVKIEVPKNLGIEEIKLLKQFDEETRKK